MGFKCGIVGLPNVGKSTLFNALTQTAAAQAANYPFCTIEPNVGEVAVPDRRLDALAAIARSAQIIPTRITFVDIAGIVRGASKGEGLGNQFLANIREVDAIAHVVRCFEDGDITHVEGRVDPLADIETIETELMLADLESLEKRYAGSEKRARAGDKEAQALIALLEPCLALLRAGKPARLLERRPEDEKAFQMLQLLTSKPVLYVCNVEEGSAQAGNAFSARVFAHAAAEGSKAVVVSAKIESEIGLRPPPAPHLLHGRPEGDARVDHHPRHPRPAGRRRDPLRLREGLHPGRDDRLRRLRAAQGRGRRARGRQAPPRGQGVRGRRRRRPPLPLQHLSARRA
jgi:hypothetical protein